MSNCFHATVCLSLFPSKQVYKYETINIRFGFSDIQGFEYSAIPWLITLTLNLTIRDITKNLIIQY